MLKPFAEVPPPPFWFFVLVCLTTGATAIRFAIRPAERTLAILRPLGAATIFSALATTLLGMANGLWGLKMSLESAAAAGHPITTPVPREILLGGACESLAPLILASALLAVVWLLVAVGLRRQP